MASETLSTKRRRLFSEIWPSGEPRNLVPVHKNFLLQALVEIGRWVLCVRKNNVDIRPACSTYLQCGKTVTDLPIGLIKRVYTVANASDQNQWCDRVYYRSASFQEIECWSNGICSVFENPANEGMPGLQEGYKYPEASTDSTYGRARVGAYAIHNGRLYVAPWLQSNESLVIEWDGYKRDWTDDDPMDTELWDISHDAVIKLYVRWCHERDYGVDRQKEKDLKAEWWEQRGDLITECDKRLAQPDSEICDTVTGPTQAELDDDEAPVRDDEIFFANIGDYGYLGAGSGLAEVAEMVNASGVDFVTTNGDNDYVGNFDTSVGQFYHQWIFPYSGAYGDGATVNKFFPVPSNHDWLVDSNAFKAYKNFFSGLPGNKRYYDFAKGPVHFFMVNSDIHEPDGITVTSKQAEWLRAKMLLSPSLWKIVIFQDPPYRSSQDHVPPLGTEFGNKTLDWPFQDWGADLVIGGDSHYYERLIVDGLTYIVNGAGGTFLANNFADPPNEFSVFRYPSDHGALFITVNCDTLSGEFKNTSGTVVDSFEIEQ